MILTLGFGGNSKELLADYKVTLGGSDTVAGKSATRLELDPTSPDMKEQWKKIDLWISDETVTRCSRSSTSAATTTR
jgi:outer membrane lipoprotein-sorting protein